MPSNYANGGTIEGFHGGESKLEAHEPIGTRGSGAHGAHQPIGTCGSCTPRKTSMSATGGPTGLVGRWKAGRVPEQKGGRRPEPIVVLVSSTVAAGRLPTGSRPRSRYMFF